MDEEGAITKNKAKLVAQGYNQQEGIDYEETLHLLQYWKLSESFLLMQPTWVLGMDVKSAFLNGKISEEVYVQQPPGFDSEFPDHVCKLDKALYGLKQAPRAWYETLSTFLIQHKFVRVKCSMLPPNNLGPDELGVSINETLFRGMIGSLMYPTTSRPDIQFSTCLCARKVSMLECKKQSSVAIASAEAEYVAAAGCCAQVLWIKSQLADYDVLYNKVPIFCDNTSAIAISNNPVLHSRTKHIDIRYHFIRDHILKGDIELHFIPTDLQLADIFTKPLVEPSFTRLVAELGMLNIEKQLNFEPEESLILSFEEVNAEEFADKSQSISTSSPPTTHLQQTKEFVVTADATKSLDASKLAEVQGIQPHTADAEKVLDQIVKEEEVAEEHLLVIPTNEADPAVATNISFMGSGPIDMTLDNVVSSSKLSSMPDDDLHYVSAFDTVKSGDDEDMADSEHIVKEGTTDTFLNASTKYHNLSGHLDHVCEEVSNLHSKIVDMESSILQSVSDQIKDHVPTLISNALQAQLPGLLTDALKECLPSILQDSLPTQLRKALTSVLQYEMGQSVTSKVRSGMQEVRDDLNSQRKSLGKLCLEVQSMQNQLYVIQGLLQSAEEQPTNLKVANKESTPLVLYDTTNEGKELVVHKVEENKLERTISVVDDSDEDDLDKQPLSNRFKIEPLIPMNSFAQKWTEHEAKKAKMIEEYNHQITFIADPLPITKISYVVNLNKVATIKMVRGDNPLNLIVHPNFRLRSLGFSEWLEVHALASKKTRKSNDMLLQSLRAKFQWVMNQAKKLGLPPPPALATFGMIVEDKKRKRTKLIKEVFMTKDIRVDRMDRNFIPFPRVVPIQELVINKPESRIFFMNENTDVAFQRETLESNVRRIQFKDIVKEVEDHLKTYSSARMDISWHLLLCRTYTVASNPISWLYKFACKLDTLSSLLVQRGRDEKKRLDHLKQDQEMLVIKIFSERKKVFRERKKCEKIRAKRDCEMVVKDIVSRLLEEEEDEEGDGGSKVREFDDLNNRKGSITWQSMMWMKEDVKDGLAKQGNDSLRM
ncbi:retrovirus-related pol polyprotein from transposon TNT 1-94 [Tanacetum coccineum]